MIDTSHLVYAGVIPLALTEAAIIALSAFLVLCTGVFTAATLRILKPMAPRTQATQAPEGGNTVAALRPTEDVLPQAATGIPATPAKDRTGTPEEPPSVSKPQSVAAARQLISRNHQQKSSRQNSRETIPTHTIPPGPLQMSDEGSGRPADVDPFPVGVNIPVSERVSTLR
jgi:hypothetical protein